MCLEIFIDELVKDACAELQKVKVPSQGNEVGLELGHCVLSKTSGAETDSLAEGTYPLVIVIAVTEVFLIVSFETERAEFSCTNVIFIFTDNEFLALGNIPGARRFLFLASGKRFRTGLRLDAKWSVWS